jgi:hypothetical protein
MSCVAQSFVERANVKNGIMIHTLEDKTSNQNR